ncbi:MAG: hypothetical protein P4N24_08750 [Acidobacteriota bacterium]|nr:hypothetical protein [Acidobacteriota bacterium]
MAAELDTRTLIFRGHGIAGWLYSSNPWVVAVVASCVAIICLNIPALFLGLDHVLDLDKRDVGYFAKYNWSLVYPLLAPILIGLGIFAFRKMRDSVYQLIEDSNYRIPVIVDKDGNVAEDYPRFIAEKLAAGAGWIEGLAAVTAFAVTAIDTSDLWPGFFNGGQFNASRVPEWDTAFRIYGSHMYGHIWANFAFDIVAYTFQTVLIFLGIFFLIKYGIFLKLMMQIIDRNQPPYQFKPWVCDLDRRLGLRPLGWVFNLFLGVVVLFQIYAFYHRIELIDSYRHAPANTYLTSIWKDIELVKDKGKVEQLKALLKVPMTDHAGIALANPSSWLPLLCSIPPIIVICLLPLGRLFWYLRREIRELKALTNVKLAKAKDEQDKKTADEMEKRLKCLRETTIWPNGSAAGSVFLVLMIALFLGATYPPILLWGLASGVVVKLIWSALGRSSRE